MPCKHIGVTPPRPVPRTRDIAETPRPLRDPRYSPATSDFGDGDFGRYDRPKCVCGRMADHWPRTADRSRSRFSPCKQATRPPRVRDVMRHYVTILADRRSLIQECYFSETELAKRTHRKVLFRLTIKQFCFLNYRRLFDVLCTR